MGNFISIDSPTDEEFEKMISYFKDNNKEVFLQFL